MIRVLVVDDHLALRAGLRTIIDSEPDMACLGESDGREESLWPLVVRNDPDVVLLDQQLPQTSGLLLCHRLKQRVPTPRVLLYSAYATPELAAAAWLAGADALLDKGAGAQELLDGIRHVARTARLTTPAAVTGQENLAPLDRLILQRMLDGRTGPEVDQELGLTRAERAAAVERILTRIDPDASATPVA
jgi:DNA-binding NarL/FixJ family response regulator